MNLPSVLVTPADDEEQRQNLLDGKKHSDHQFVVSRGTKGTTDDMEMVNFSRTSRPHDTTEQRSWKLHRGFLRLMIYPLTSLLARKNQQNNVALTGWHAGVASCSLTALGVLIINFVLLVWAVARHGVEHGYGVLFQGDCAKARHISTALHILINVLSTILLGASNYTMQCLNSPTRIELDQAHAQRKWVDIGIPSWRNRHWVSRRDTALWWLLAWSSVPLHLLYNSSVFLEVSAQEYNVSFINETTAAAYSDHSLGNMASLTCTGELVMVSPVFPNQTTIKMGSNTHWNTSTILNTTMRWHTPLSHFGNVSIDGQLYFNATSCYSEYMPQKCKVDFSVPIIVVVIVCNLSKVVCMTFTVWFSTGSKLITLGDAIASFLEDPDSTTSNLCLMSKEDAQTIWTKPKKPRMWEPVKEKVFYSANERRWTIVNLSFALVAGALLTVAIMVAMGSIKSFQTGIGFAASLSKVPLLISTAVTANNASGILFNVIVANIPQSLVSLINVFYNGLLTCFLLGEEWNGLAHLRQPLRVTTPKGQQKSNYYLTIPYQYAIPVMAMSGVFHWLTSESLFFIRITAIYQGKERPDDSISSLGYSPLAMVLACIVCILMLCFIDIKSQQRYHLGSPLASPCSAAISAACHPPPDEVNVALKSVQWGVVKGARESLGSWKNKDKDFGHCSFSGELVAPPIPGRYYA